MCGIVGVVGDLTAKEEGIFKDMLILNTLRGKDSVGVAAIGANVDDVHVVKSMGDPFQLFDRNSFDVIMRRKNRGLIGHNRAATIGKTTIKNAHPFEFDSVVGVHNGTLRNKWKIPEQERFETDSEALYNQINKVGVEKALEHVDGAYALVWFDKDEKTINFLRNKERPLYTIMSEDKKCLFYASEAWMATVIMNRMGYKHLAAEELPEDTLVSIKIPLSGEIEKARVRTVKPLPFPVTTVATSCGSTVSKFTKKSETSQDTSQIRSISVGQVLRGLFPTHYSRNDFGAWYVVFKADEYPSVPIHVYVDSVADARDYTNSAFTYEGKVSFVNLVTGKEHVKLAPYSVEEETITIPKLKLDHQGRDISKEDFDKKYDSGCVWCMAPVLYEDDGWKALSGSTVLCGNCCNDPEISQYLPEIQTWKQH